MEKVKYLEGMRGFAALMVLNEHLIKFFFAAAFIDSSLRAANFGVLEELSFPPFNLLHNGASAVSFFFVLSGFVLSYKFFSNKSEYKVKLLGGVLKRYIRICIPVTASLAIIYFLLKVDAVSFSSVVALTGSNEVNFFNDPMPFINVLKQGLLSTILLDDFSYNPVLWTITTEVVGSFLTILLLFLFAAFQETKGALAIRMIIYAISILILFPTTLAAFLLGIMLCDLVHHDKVSSILERYSKFWVPVALAVGIMLLSYSIKGMHTGIYKYITINEFNPLHEYIYNMWGALLVMAAAIYTPSIQKIFAHKAMQWLGNISFSLYLTHYAVIISVTLGVYLYLPIEDHLIRSSVSVALSLPVIFAVAALFNRFIDKPSVSLSNQFYKIVTKSRKSDDVQATPAVEC